MRAWSMAARSGSRSWPAPGPGPVFGTGPSLALRILIRSGGDADGVDPVRPLDEPDLRKRPGRRAGEHASVERVESSVVAGAVDALVAPVPYDGARQMRAHRGVRDERAIGE